MEPRIAICITTHNRRESAVVCINHWLDLLPKNATLFIVDDGSAVPFENASIRFDTPQGIAKAKNTCLSLAENFDYIFLADDDIYPVKKDWETVYINSGLNHACFTFGRKVLNITESYTEYEKPCGCLLFITKDVLQKVGGLDIDFIGYGFDHVNWSDRIFNNGLTPARYIDVPKSQYYFCSLDMHGKVNPSIPASIRAATIPMNFKLYQEKFLSKEFKPFK